MKCAIYLFFLLLYNRIDEKERLVYVRRVTVELSQQNQILDDFCRAINQIVDIIVRVARALSDWLHSVMKEINPKVYHLAYRGSTARIRNKNKRRLFGCLMRLLL